MLLCFHGFAMLSESISASVFCLKSSATFDSTIQKPLPSHLTHLFAGNFLSSLCLSTLFPSLFEQVYFLTFSVKAALTLLFSSQTLCHLLICFPLSSSHLNSFLSYCLYSFWQAYVRELVVKSITIVLHRAIFGGMTRQMSVEMYWCPS